MTNIVAAKKQLIGMLHSPPLPGSPRYSGNLSAIRDAILRDAEAFATGGFDALMLENFGDMPFYPGRVPAETIAHLTALACAVRQRFQLPLGINVLRNDGESALAIAHASGASFLRVNVLAGVRVADQGILEGRAHELLRLRRSLGAESIRILADVDVKHSAPLSERPIEQETADLLLRAGADGVIVSGHSTGSAVAADLLQRVKTAAGTAPIFVGSGASIETVSLQATWADGFIVGSSLKCGSIDSPIDVAKVRAFVEKLSADA